MPICPAVLNMQLVTLLTLSRYPASQLASSHLGAHISRHSIVMLFVKNTINFR